MPICNNCHHKWSWKQTVKKMFTLVPSMTCPFCKQKQYQTRRSKRKAASINMLSLVPLLLNLLFDIPTVLILSLFPILFLFLISINPFLIQLSNEEEHMTF